MSKPIIIALSCVLADILCGHAVRASQRVRILGQRRLGEFLRSLWTQVGKHRIQGLQSLGIPVGTFPSYHNTLWNFRLHNPTECPYNGSRRDDCQCRKDYTAAGLSSFQKIRIDLVTMQIISKFSMRVFADTLLISHPGSK